MVARSPAVLDLDKLNWMNQQYIKKLDNQELSERLEPFIAATPYVGQVAQLTPQQREWLMEAVRERMVCLKDIENLLPVFFDQPDPDKEAWAVLSQPGVKQVLEAIQAKLPLKEDPEEYRQYIRATVKEFKLKAKDVFMPVRCALTGLVHGPDLHLIMAAWGRQETARRLEKSLTGLTKFGNACAQSIIPAILYGERRWRGAGVVLVWREVNQGKGDDSMKRSKSILVRLTEQEQKELLQAVESWNQCRESWQDEVSISKYIRDAIEEKINREKRKRKRNT